MVGTKERAGEKKKGNSAQGRWTGQGQEHQGSGGLDKEEMYFSLRGQETAINHWVPILVGGPFTSIPSFIPPQTAVS